MKKRWKITVSGRVQGVFFRASTVEFVEGSGLKVSGYVKNLTNGSVEVLIEGTEESLEKVLGFLKIGPSHAQVKDISVYKEDIDSFKYDNFSII